MFTCVQMSCYESIPQIDSCEAILSPDDAQMMLHIIGYDLKAAEATYS